MSCLLTRRRRRANAALLGLPLATTLVIAGLLHARRTLLVVDVVGNSMSPVLHDGDKILIRRTRRLRLGDIVIVHQRALGQPSAPRPPGATGWLVKRLVALPGDTVPDAAAGPASPAGRTVPPGRAVILGEHPESADSRTLGFIALDDLGGVMLRRVGPRTERSRPTGPGRPGP